MIDFRQIFADAVCISHGEDPDLVCTEKVATELKTFEEMAPIWRKIASFYEGVLADNPITSESKSRFLLKELANWDTWTECQKEVLDTATECIMDAHYGYNTKSAGLIPAWLAALIPSRGPQALQSTAQAGAIGIASLAALGALGGGVAHHVGRGVTDEDLHNQKLKAQIAEYRNLAEEIDRRIKSRHFQDGQ